MFCVSCPPSVLFVQRKYQKLSSKVICRIMFTNVKGYSPLIGFRNLLGQHMSENLTAHFVVSSVSAILLSCIWYKSQKRQFFFSEAYFNNFHSFESITECLHVYFVLVKSHDQANREKIVNFVELDRECLAPWPPFWIPL